MRSLQRYRFQQSKIQANENKTYALHVCEALAKGYVCDLSGEFLIVLADSYEKTTHDIYENANAKCIA